MINKLLLSTLAIVSTINLANAQSDPKEIAYPVDIIAGGTLNLTSSTTGYKFSAVSTVTADHATKQATITADKDVTYDKAFSATGGAKLTYANVTFNNDLTLSAGTTNTSAVPQMDVKGDMIFGGDNNINTGSTEIEFSGATSKLDITKLATSTKIANLKVKGANSDSTKSLNIIYNSDESIDETSMSTKRSTLNSILSSDKFTFTNATIQDIYVGGGNETITPTPKTEGATEYNISISKGSAGSKFIADDSTLNKTVTDKQGLTLVEASGGGGSTINFGVDMNTGMTLDESTQVTPNTAGNVLTDWDSDKTYTLSNSTKDNASFEFLLDIQPTGDATKILKVGAASDHSTTTGKILKTVIFRGEQNNKLTVSLQSASLNTVQFSPAKNSYCKIDASDTVNKTAGDAKNLSLEVLDYAVGTASELKAFTIFDVPDPGAQYDLEDTSGNKLDKDGNTTTNPANYVKVKPTYSLTVGKNVNVILTNKAYSFKDITVNTTKDQYNSKITVGDGATLNL